MKNKVLCNLILVLSCAMLLKQAVAQSPGGVKNPIVWQKEFGGNDYKENGNDLFNFHAYKYFKDEFDGFDQQIPELNKISIFIVFSSNAKADIGVISTGKSDLLLNDSSLTSSKILKYVDTDLKPKFLSYVEKFNSLKESSQFPAISFGGNNSSSETIFRGGISEIIIYDRLISKLQRKKIESYLSLKYGISLPDSSDYINSNGDKIWEWKKNAEYIHHLTGIGRDDVGELRQMQSKNLYSNADLAIGIGEISELNSHNMHSIKNHSYLLWSDNGLETKFYRGASTDTKEFMKRVWQVKVIGSDLSSQKCRIRYKYNDDYEISENNTLWLVRNRKSAGLFNFLEADYIKMDKNIDGCFYADIVFDPDQSGKDLFTFIKGPRIVVNIAIDSILCDQSHMQIGLDILGIFKPIDVRVNSTPKVRIAPISNGYIKSKIQNISYGINELELFDGEELLYSKVFFVTQADCKNNPTVNSEQILFPNPVFAGSEFSVKIKLSTEEDVFMTIYNSLGDIIFQKNIGHYTNEVFYKDKIDIAGNYFVELKGKNISKTHKLIVIK